MKRFAITLALVLPVGLVSACCCRRVQNESAEMMLCGECGMEKGSKGCCDPAAMHCEKCGMIKGSPGCCKAK